MFMKLLGLHYVQKAAFPSVTNTCFKFRHYHENFLEHNDMKPINIKSVTTKILLFLGF